jgi:hypothetical protein
MAHLTASSGRSQKPPCRSFHSSSSAASSAVLHKVQQAEAYDLAAGLVAPCTHA